jgi:iron complex outermembrane receptor protein
VHAQDEATELDRIEVTGSRIKRVDIEGPSPVTVIERADLEVSGDISVADVLRAGTFNTFGSFRESSGNTAQSQATISLRGVGSQRTLLLLDGRRLASSPVLGAAAQNLNAIPFAAVERIEILRDGASAIYGSDAIGGVINIILRKDYEGLQFAAQFERPTRGEPDANSGSVTGGVSSDRGNLTFVIDHQERDIFFNRDRNTGIPGLNPAVGLSAFGFPGSAYVYDSTDGSFSGDFVGLFADPRCPTTLGSDPLFPNSVLTDLGDGDSLCRFNYAATSANEASLRKDSLLVNGSFEISDNVSAFARITTLSGSSFGRYAATPVTSPYPTISGDNPNNPFGGDARLLYRLVAAGTRDSTVKDHMMDVLVGFEGSMDWFGGSDWEVGLRHSRYEIDSIGTGYGLAPLLQTAIDDGSFNPFGDPRDPAFQAAVQGFSHTILQNSETRVAAIDGQMSFDLFEMANGAASLATGFEYVDTRFEDLVDFQSAAGNVQGTAGGPAAGERAQYAVFAEAYVPILTNLSVQLAARYDHYNDFGNSTNPKVSVEFRPLDNLLVRGSWGTGFRAPDLQILNQAPLQSFTEAIDTLGCAQELDLPFPPCTQQQYETYFQANPNLGPEESTNWGVGVVFNPIDNLTISADWYDIELSERISSLPVQDILDLEAEGSPIVDGLVIRSPVNGSVDRIIAPALNLSGFKTSGLDLEIDYRMDSDWGSFNPYINITWVDEFVSEILPGTGFDDFIGLSVPDTKAQAGVNWSFGDFAAGIVSTYIGDSEQDVAGTTQRIGSWTTTNLQASWTAPWNGKVTLGVRNVGDREPPLNNVAFGHPFYANSQYDFYGRVPYVRYEQNF